MIRLFATVCTVILFWVDILSARDEPTTGSSLPNPQTQVDPWQILPLGLDPARVIDLAIEDGWRSNHVEPTSPVDDRAFLRRVFLDLVGRIPRASESRAFLAETHSKKREELIDTLLASDEHAEHFAEILDALLIGRTDVEQIRRRTKALWLEYLKRSVLENRPWNEFARETILARPADQRFKGASWYVYSRNNKPQDIAESVSKDFFGVRIDCAQCHDHPLSSEIEQRHYWGLVAFFNRSKNVETADGPSVSESAIGGFSEFANLQGQSQPNELVYLGDRKVDEDRPAKDVKEEDRDELYVSTQGASLKVPKFSRREQFVEKILNEHPLMASAVVNKLWGWMMGRGLVHPVDTIDSYHPASHPGLLDWLARDFKHSGYNVRRLIKSLAMTRAYQLSSAQTKVVDPQWFSSALPKPLTAEMLQRSFLVALEPTETERWNSLESRAEFAKAFPDVLAEESIANVSQGLLLTNGVSLNELVSVKHSELLKGIRSDLEHNKATSPIETAIKPMFERLFGRLPDVDEANRCEAYLTERSDRLDQAIEGIAWALLTSSEFRFNH
ncbi:MAG: DUF1549 domain-containing protein [Pirellula sp.]